MTELVLDDLKGGEKEPSDAESIGSQDSPRSSDSDSPDSEDKQFIDSDSDSEEDEKERRKRRRKKRNKSVRVVWCNII